MELTVPGPSHAQGPISDEMKLLAKISERIGRQLVPQCTIAKIGGKIGIVPHTGPGRVWNVQQFEVFTDEEERTLRQLVALGFVLCREVNGTIRYELL